MEPIIEKGATVLFQGDSITDAGRSRDSDADMGRGYPALIAAWFSAQYPEREVTFINRGISGNRAKDLAARWQEDCLDLKPTWVSILIGINDTWRRYDADDPTPVDEYASHFRSIVEAACDVLHVGLIILEPFVLPVPADRASWRADLDPKIAVARSLAREFEAHYIPLDGLFAAAATKRDMSFWLPDGVHPSPAGHALIAQAWLRTVHAIP